MNIIGRGYNRPSDLKYCSPCIREDINDNSRTELCSALHAEENAIINAAANFGEEALKDSVMYHIKTKNKEPRPSGEPSCTICSRKILQYGLKEFVLWKGGDKYAAYSAKELNDLSFEYVLKVYKKSLMQNKTVA